MRFDKYLTENYSYEQIMEILLRECSQVLKIYKSSKQPLWRGTYGGFETFKVMTPRDNRKPRDTKRWVHDFWDQAFYEKFHWRVRSEGVFVVSDRDTACSFGHPYLFFPGDGYKFVWSPDVRDLTVKSMPFNFAYDTLTKNIAVLRSYTLDIFDELTKPDMKTGRGPGHWELFGTDEQSRTIDEIIEYLKTRDGEENDVIFHGIEKETSHYVAKFSFNGKRLDAYWSFEIEGEVKEKLVDYAKKNMMKAAKESARRYLDTYQNHDLKRAIFEGVEIAFKCNKYYLVEGSFYIDDRSVFHKYIHGERG